MASSSIRTAASVALRDPRYYGVELSIDGIDEYPYDHSFVLVRIRHPAGMYSVQVALESSISEQIRTIADRTQDELIGTVVDSSWPRCSLHPDTHPMEASVVDACAWWTCPRIKCPIVKVGSLGGKGKESIDDGESVS